MKAVYIYSLGLSIHIRCQLRPGPKLPSARFAAVFMPSPPAVAAAAAAAAAWADTVDWSDAPPPAPTVAAGPAPAAATTTTAAAGREWERELLRRMEREHCGGPLAAQLFEATGGWAPKAPPLPSLLT